MPLTKDIGVWIKDFMKSNAAQFQGKTKEERKNMALAAYRAKYGSLNEESRQLDTTDFEKVVQAVKSTGHPATVMLVPKWNEIEIITGMNAPDELINDINKATSGLGYSHKELSMSGDSSSLGRGEYSEIEKVNGGHMDYRRFEESVNEEKKLTYNDFVRMVRDDMMAGAAPDEKPSDKQVASRAKAYYNDYLQGASVDDLFEATKEGLNEFTQDSRDAGALAAMTGAGQAQTPDFLKKHSLESIKLALRLGTITKYELRDAITGQADPVIAKKVSRALQDTMNESSGFKSGKEFINIKLKNYPKAVAKINQLIDMIGESNFTMEMAEWIWDFFNNASFESPVNEATKDEETTFHKKLDKLVHDTFGKRKGEMEEAVDQKQADIYAYQFMQYFDKMRRIVGGNFGDDTRKEFEKLVQDKFSKHTVNETEELSDKADLNKDGKLSSYEKKRGAAIEKAMAKAKSLKKESDDTPEEQRATKLSIDAEKAKIVAAQKKIQNLSKGVAEQQLNEGMGWDYEGKMAQAQLLSIVKNARDLFQMMDANTQLKSWVQSKLTKAEDYLNSVRTYLEGESLTNTTPLVVSENRMTDDEGVGLNIGDVVKAADGGIYQIIYSYSEGKPFMVPFDLKRRRPTSLASKTYFDQGDILTKRMTKVLDYSATKGGFMK